ncbi:MAG: flavodoxin-dependent (E)-4-hydroxy-3-methylbut-2-enyl-diphosphate synthase, partial [Actinomycetota bacterium]
HRGVNIISCPSCARQGFNVIKTVEVLEERLKHISTPMSLSIIGCVVNGPGEAREADLGIAAGKGQGVLVVKGEVKGKVPEDKFVEVLVTEARKMAAERARESATT